MAQILPTYPDLEGKVAVVTGGSCGIGAATCRLLAANGARVVVNGRDRGAIDDLVEELRWDGGQVLGIAADCTDFGAIEEMRHHVEREFGHIDVLIACAGGHGTATPTEQIAEEAWRCVIDANLTTTFLAVKSVLPGMIERRRGAIVTVASSAGRLPSAASSAYAAAKAAVVMFSRHLAGEVGAHGIRVNCVAPSLQGGAMGLDLEAGGIMEMPLGRAGAPDDVALAALFLASDSASWVSGVTLDVAGGRVSV